MTLGQFIDFVRNRLNAASDGYWSDAEIYALISARANLASAIIGLIQATDTSTTTVIGTQAYSWPSTAAAITGVSYNGESLQEISFREWDKAKSAGTTPTGTPEKYVLWNRQVLLVPIPSDTKTLTFYFEKEHPFIDEATDTIDLPPILHYALVDGVLADMFAKEKNVGMTGFYENKWAEHMAVTFPRYAERMTNRARAKICIDADTSRSTENGVV